MGIQVMRFCDQIENLIRFDIAFSQHNAHDVAAAERVRHWQLRKRFLEGKTRVLDQQPNWAILCEALHGL